MIENIKHLEPEKAAKIGAVCYVLWGVIHLFVAYNIFALGGTRQPGSVVQARIWQDAAFILATALITIYVAIKMNWRNDILGWKINLCLVSFSSVVYAVFFVFPGVISIGRGITLPGLWILALAFTTFGVKDKGVYKIWK